MPIYTYECPECGISRDLFVPILDRDKEHKCPECKETLHRKLSLCNYQLKGGGFFGKGLL